MVLVVVVLVGPRWPICSSFFYLWKVHPDDRYRLAVTLHRGQEIFNVAVMGYRNSPAYVQRMIDNLLRPHRDYSRSYVDDVVVRSKDSFQDHIQQLDDVFSTLTRVWHLLVSQEIIPGLHLGQVAGPESGLLRPRYIWRRRPCFAAWLVWRKRWLARLGQ